MWATCKHGTIFPKGWQCFDIPGLHRTNPVQTLRWDHCFSGMRLAKEAEVEGETHDSGSPLLSLYTTTAAIFLKIFERKSRKRSWKGSQP